MTLRKEDIALIHKLTGQEEKVHADDLLLYHRIMTTSTNWDVQSVENIDFSKIESKLEAGKAANKSSKWMVAASVTALLLIGSWFIYLADVYSVNIPMAEQKTLWLPDSSKVILNANAQLRYSRRSWKKHVRKVQLSGIAYFEVRKGSRFTVETEHGEVAVLGTSFNVKALSNDFIVECFTGKVAVSHHEVNQSLVLTPGLKVETSNTNPVLASATFNTTRGKEWVNGTFNFDGQKLSNVLDEVGRQFNLVVQYEESEARYYTGTFSNKDLNKALEAICKPMGLKYQHDKEKQLLKIYR